MAKNSYAAGRRFEYRVRDSLKNLGYLVIRTPGSRSPFDLVVLGASGKAWLVQCKVDGRLGPEGWNDLFHTANAVKALPLVAFRQKRKIVWRQLMGAKTGLRRAQPWGIIHVLANATDANRTLEYA